MKKIIPILLLVLALAGCSASVATSNPACLLLCQNSGSTSTEVAKDQDLTIKRKEPQ